MEDPVGNHLCCRRSSLTWMDQYSWGVSLRIGKFILLFAFAIFGVTWTIIITPSMMQSSWWNALNPVKQYLLYNIGMFFILSVMFGGFVTFLITQRLSLIQVFWNGLAGFLFFSFVLDMWQPPWSISPQGEFLLPAGASMAATSVDYMTGWSFMWLGAHGPVVYWLTYALVPIFVIVLTVILLGMNKFLKVLQEGL